MIHMRKLYLSHLLFIFILLLFIISSSIAFLWYNYLSYIMGNIILSIYIIYLSIVYARKNKKVMILILIIIPFIYVLLNNLATHFSTTLTWDLKAQENVASYISLNGHFPAPMDGIYRPEYTSYPAAYILLASLNEITTLPIYLLMKLPVLTIILYVIFLWIIVDIFERTNIYLHPLIIAILFSTFIFNYKLISVFIYQNFGIILYILLVYLFYRMLLLENNSSEILIMITILMFTVTFSVSDSAIALFITSIGFFLYSFTVKNRRIIFVFSALAMMSILAYLLWYVTYFAVPLISMIKTIIGYLLSTGGSVISAGIHKYTPLDYTLPEFALYVTFLFLLLVVALVSSLFGLLKLLKEKKFMIYLAPLIIIGLSFIFLFLFTPYKSDMSLKLLPFLSPITTFSFMEISREVKYIKNYKLLSIILVILCSIMILIGSSINGNKGYFSEIYVKYNIFAEILKSIHLAHILGYSQVSSIAILDSPSLPYYFIRDYVAPRLMVSYNVFVTEPNIQYYNYTLINNLREPRFVLILQQAPLFNNSIAMNYNIIIGDKMYLAKLNNVDLVYSVYNIGIGIPIK